MRHRRGEEDLSGRTLCFAQSVLPEGLRFYGKFVLCSIWSCWEVGFGNATAIALARDAAAKLPPGVMPVETCGVCWLVGMCMLCLAALGCCRWATVFLEMCLCFWVRPPSLGEMCPPL